MSNTQNLHRTFSVARATYQVGIPITGDQLEGQDEGDGDERSIGEEPSPWPGGVMIRNTPIDGGW
jgi:hypothetical protein